MVEPGQEDRWPLLIELGWLIPTDGESEIADTLAQQKPSEQGHDLGHRAVLPKGLTAVLGGPRSNVVQSIMPSIAKSASRSTS